jgi:hypothetical protein
MLPLEDLYIAMKNDLAKMYFDLAVRVRLLQALESSN